MLSAYDAREGPDYFSSSSDWIESLQDLQAGGPRGNTKPPAEQARHFRGEGLRTRFRPRGAALGFRTPQCFLSGAGLGFCPLPRFLPYRGFRLATPRRFFPCRGHPLSRRRHHPHQTGATLPHEPDPQLAAPVTPGGVRRDPHVASIQT